jgi:hypothetical protein
MEQEVWKNKSRSRRCKGNKSMEQEVVEEQKQEQEV